MFGAFPSLGLVGWVVLHFYLILAVSLRDTFPILTQSSDSKHQGFWRESAQIVSTALGEKLSESNPIRQAIATYENCAGIEAGYGYFAPSVPSSCKLVLELHYPGDRVEYELPAVGGAAAGYRLATLLDNVEQFHDARVREMLLKRLVSSIWQRHPEATIVRAIFGYVDLPTMDEYRKGTRVSYKLLYSYDFRVEPRKPAPMHQ